MEVVLLPIEAAAFEAGLLASAIVYQSYTIVIMYAHYYRDAINGLRNAVVQACPLCSVKSFGVCSGSYDCPGQWDRFIAFAGDADVVITAAHVSDLLPTMVFTFNDLNATQLGLPKKYVIVVGDVLDNIGAAVRGNPYFMGVLRIQLDSTLANAVQGLIHNNFTAAIRIAPTAWNRPFTNASVNPGIKQNDLTQFALNAKLFDWGTFVPVYSAIDKAEEDSARIGGTPFVPIGDVMTGFDQNIAPWSTAAAQPSISDNTAATCELYDRVVVVSADLKYVSVISGLQAQAKQIPLVLSDAMFARGANTSHLSGYYNYSLRPSPNASARVRMVCSMVPDSTYGNPNVWMLSGGLYVNRTTGFGMSAQANPSAAVHETLRLRLVCLDPYSIWCDFFVLENVTSLVLASPVNDSVAFWHGSASGIGARLLTPRGVAATLSNVSFLLQSYDSLSAAAITSSGVWMGVVERPDVITVLRSIRVLPPAAFADTDAALFRPMNVSWSTALRGVLAVDLRRRVMVFLPVMDLALPLGRTPAAVSAGWWGTSGSSAAPESIRWVDYTTAIPRTITVSDNGVTETLPCTFKSFEYLSSLDRLAIVLRASYTTAQAGALRGGGYASPTDALSVYHYSTLLQRWVLQSSLQVLRTSAGVQDYAVLPLQDLWGGAWLLYPTSPSSNMVGTALIVYDVTTLNTYTTCDSTRGFAIAPDGVSCYVCSGGQAATADGFCVDMASTADNYDAWVVPLAGSVGAAIIVVVCAFVLRFLYNTRWSHKARIALLRERATKLVNAPLSGRTAIITVMIVDADVLWQTCGENIFEAEYGDDDFRRRHEDDNSSVSSGASGSSCGKGKMGDRRRPRETASTAFVLKVLDRLHEALCESTSANGGYLAEYRGEVAVVVHKNPASLLCIALEVSIAMAQHRPPVRLAMGLHIGNVVRNVDVYGATKCVFAGEGMTVAARVASLSATGFVSGRWMASQQFVDRVDAEAPGVMTALTLSRGDTSQIRYEGIVTVVQEIASAMLVDALGDQSSFDLARQRRAQQLKERRKNTKAATGGGRNKPNADTGGGGGGVPRTVHASKVRRNIANRSNVHDAFDVSDAFVPPPESHNPFLLPRQQRACTPLTSPLSMELPAAAAIVVVPPPVEAPGDRDATPALLPIAARGSGVASTAMFESPSLRPRHEATHFFIASPLPSPNSIQCGVPSGVQDDAGSPLHGQMSDSKSTRLSLSEAEQLEMFAAQIGRVVLSHLPAAAVDILVNRLHIPNFRKHHTTGKYPATVPKASLRHFSQRIVAITNTDLGAALHNARAALTAADRYSSSGSISGRSGVTAGNSRGDNGGSISAAVGEHSVVDGGGVDAARVARFECLVNQCTSPVSLMGIR
jgi:hypothetical protein